MASIHEAVVELEGFPGGPGYSVFYFGSLVTDIGTDLNAFYTAIASHIPDNVTIKIPSSGKTLDDANGNLMGAWSGTPAADVVGGNMGAYSAPVGLIVRWTTTGIVRNRIVKGRTFIVPLGSGVWDTDGSLSSTVISDAETAAAALVGSSASELLVWSRPKRDASGTVTDPGSSFAVESSSVPDKAAVLTSRRD